MTITTSPPVMSGRDHTTQDNSNEGDERLMSINANEVIKPGATVELGFNGSTIEFHAPVVVATVREMDWGLLVGLKDHGELCIHREHLSSIERVTSDWRVAYSLVVGDVGLWVQPDPLANAA